LKRAERVKTIVVTGPESTGKTTLSQIISEQYKAKYFPEFAREYVGKLERPYEYGDLVAIAKHQISDFFDYSVSVNYKYRVFDTGLIITKVWFDLVYNDIPLFLSEALNELNVELTLLCYPDIPWIADGIRENGGIKRFELFERYKSELELYKFEYVIIKGNNNKRILSAKQYIDSAHSL
jgi:nicotinamide riboside kinase